MIAQGGISPAVGGELYRHFGKGYSRMQREAARTEDRTASGEAEQEKQKEKRIRRN